MVWVQKLHKNCQKNKHKIDLCATNHLKEKFQLGPCYSKYNQNVNKSCILH